MSNTKLSLVTLRESKQLVEHIKNNIRQHSITIDLINTDDILIKVSYKNFYFTVYHGEIRGQQTKINYFAIAASPGNEYDTSEKKSMYGINPAKTFFTNWLNGIEEYSSIVLDENPILKAYEEEFYLKYETLLGEDADIKPFEREQQRQLHFYLGCMANAIGEKFDEDERITPIIDEIKEVQSKMTTMSQSGTLLKITKIFAKIHAYGIDLSNTYLGKAQEEGFKMIVRQTLEDAKQIAAPAVDTIKEFFT